VITDSPTPIRTGVDRRRMERILGNLLENAARYAGGATAIAVNTSEHAVTISINDSGNGITADERVRKAMIMAVDRETIVKEILGGQA